MNYLKKLLYLVLAISFSTSQAGAFDDFFKAIKLDDARTVQALLAQGFDANSLNEQGQAPLYLALREGNFKVCAALLDHSLTKLDQTNAVGETALMMAALRGHAEWAGRLLDRGARLNGPDNGDQPAWTPLHYAASGPGTATVALLLSRGARVDVRSPNGSTPLMMAAQYGPEDAVMLLLQKGADPLAKNDLGLTAADFARRAGRESLTNRLQAGPR